MTNAETIAREIEELVVRLHRADNWAEASAAELMLEAADALTAATAEIDQLKALAKKLTVTLMDFTPGGSEYFIKIGDDYYADADLCGSVVRDRLDRAHQRSLDAIRERNTATTREANLRDSIWGLNGLVDHIRDQRDVAEAENTRLKEACRAIIIRCTEGDKRSDWLPIIETIARAALSPATEGIR